MSAFADIPSFTWGNRPAAGTVPAGTLIRISDVGLPGGIYVMSDGVSTWSPVGPQCLARSASPVSTTGDTNENILATVNVPAAAMGPNGALLVYSTWSYTNSANNKTMRARLGGIGGTQHLAIVATTSATLSDMRRIRNRNSMASQVGGSSGSGIFGAAAGALTASAVDMSVAQPLVLTAQNGLASETITLENYEVWLLP